MAILVPYWVDATLSTGHRLGPQTEIADEPHDAAQQFAKRLAPWINVNEYPLRVVVTYRLGDADWYCIVYSVERRLVVEYNALQQASRRIKARTEVEINSLTSSGV